MDLVKIATEFESEDDCLEYLASIRWPDGVSCPHCGSDRVTDLSTRREWQCNGCRKQFSATAGTVMHRSHLSARQWLIALHLVCSAKKGVSACQLERHIDVSYRTAWYLLQRIRSVMAEDEILSALQGVVEADETYVKADTDEAQEDSQSTNAPVFGVQERGGDIRTASVPDRSSASLIPLIERFVDEDAEVHTDEFLSYSPLRKRGYAHKVVKHMEQYVDGNVHTNGVESFWSLLKRGIIGTYHHVSLKYLPLYLREFEGRFNARDSDTGDATQVLTRRCLMSPNALAGLMG